MWYTIQHGDSLSLIAQKYLGSLMLYNEIYEQNKDVLASPELVYAGTQIWIPIDGKKKPGLISTEPILMQKEETYQTMTPYNATFETTSTTQASDNSQPDGFLRITDPQKFNKMMTYGGIGLLALAALIAFK